MDYTRIKTIIEDDVWYPLALIYLCGCAFAVGLVIGGVWILCI